jgi:hypothetical protein
MRAKKNAYRFLVEKHEGAHLKSSNAMVWCGLDSSGSRYRPMAGSCEDGNENSGSIKCAEFLEQQQ